MKIYRTVPCGVTVAQQTLNLFVIVQIYARQPWETATG